MAVEPLPWSDLPQSASAGLSPAVQELRQRSPVPLPASLVVVFVLLFISSVFPPPAHPRTTSGSRRSYRGGVGRGVLLVLPSLLRCPPRRAN